METDDEREKYENIRISVNAKSSRAQIDRIFYDSP